MLRYHFEDGVEIVDTIIREDADKRNVPFNKLIESYVNQKARVGQRLHTLHFNADGYAYRLVFVEEFDSPMGTLG